MIAYLALGSNLGDRAAHLAAAVRALADLGRVAGCSGLYETRPEGGALQPDYVNAVVRLETGLSPRALLDGCLAVERQEGRVRPVDAVRASRTLDMDVLLCDDRVIAEPGLVVPHPRLLVRPFVRIPLAEVALPGLCHPQTHEALTTAEADPTVRKLGPMPR
jgi:2-amino-4-hydroxy-6-hydroxymethyldihydropteridine diphosphokinase